MNQFSLWNMSQASLRNMKQFSLINMNQFRKKYESVQPKKMFLSFSCRHNVTTMSSTSPPCQHSSKKLALLGPFLTHFDQFLAHFWRKWVKNDPTSDFVSWQASDMATYAQSQCWQNNLAKEVSNHFFFKYAHQSACIRHGPIRMAIPCVNSKNIKLEDAIDCFSCQEMITKFVK